MQVHLRFGRRPSRRFAKQSGRARTNRRFDGLRPKCNTICIPKGTCCNALICKRKEEFCNKICMQLDLFISPEVIPRCFVHRRCLLQLHVRRPLVKILHLQCKMFWNLSPAKENYLWCMAFSNANRRFARPISVCQKQKPVYLYRKWKQKQRYAFASIESEGKQSAKRLRIHNLYANHFAR